MANLPEYPVLLYDGRCAFCRQQVKRLQQEKAELRDELRDRFGVLPPEADRLMIVFELRVLGARLGLQTVIVNGNEARLRFRQGTAPSMAGLNAALDEVQFAAEVRQVVPLSLKLRRLGGLEIGPGLVRALSVALDRRTAARSAV